MKIEIEFPFNPDPENDGNIHTVFGTTHGKLNTYAAAWLDDPEDNIAKLIVQHIEQGVLQGPELMGFLQIGIKDVAMRVLEERDLRDA